VAENTESQSAPLWAWLLGLLPWVWIVPFNQYFWDDWLVASTTDFDWHLKYWVTDGAKSWANPFWYPILISLGPWSFGIMASICAVVTGAALSRILTKVPGSIGIRAGWVGPILLALPVFHARFSAAVLEYLFAMTFLIVGWWRLVIAPTWRGELIGVLLLAIAIGVPSLAILYPVVFLHIVWSRAEKHGRCLWVKHGFRYLYVVVIPAAFAIIFSQFINSSRKYSASEGALTEFARGLGVLAVGLAALLLFVRWRQYQNFRNWIWVSSLSLGAYIGFFPYFAVGYNPLADFLPWRMRKQILDAAPLQITVAFFLLSALGICVVNVSGKTSLTERVKFPIPVFLAAGFGSVAIVLGPMDWESRHWLITWPVLAVLTLAILATTTLENPNLLLRAVFLTLLAASLLISSEYLIDSLKQRAITTAVKDELRGRVQTISDTNETLLIVIELDDSAHLLNARNRVYRSYEWRGIIAAGLGVGPETLKIVEVDDVENLKRLTCGSLYRATVIKPQVVSTRLEVITGFRVSLNLQPSHLNVCSLAVPGD
jgi:hypothetical protein